MDHAFISVHLQKIIVRLAKKDPQLHGQLLHKINEIIHEETLDHYKNLRYIMKDSKRVHIGPFVLVFHSDEKTKTLYFDDFDHHDRIYK
jgi:mRNA-degrading endonuclease RelE of RelBE toxin-antitoxin system